MEKDRKRSKVVGGMWGGKMIETEDVSRRNTHNPKVADSNIFLQSKKM